MQNNISLLVALKNNLEYNKHFYKTTRDLYPELEICFSSYNSIDGTHEWLDSLNDPYTKIFHSTQQGIFSDNFNKATELATKEYVDSTRPYKVYVALLSQSGTSAPTAIVLENTIGAVSFAYNSTGFYSAVSSGLFTVDKTACFLGESNGNTTLIAKGNTANLVTIVSQSPSGTFINDSISKATLEIRVYN